MHCSQCCNGWWKQVLLSLQGQRLWRTSPRVLHWRWKVTINVWHWFQKQKCYSFSQVWRQCLSSGLSWWLPWSTSRWIERNEANLHDRHGKCIRRKRGLKHPWRTVVCTTSCSWAWFNHYQLSPVDCQGPRLHQYEQRWKTGHHLGQDYRGWYDSSSLFSRWFPCRRRELFLRWVGRRAWVLK